MSDAASSKVPDDVDTTRDPSSESESAGESGTDSSQMPPFTHTRASGFWPSVVVGLLLLVVLIIFILENGQRASISFLGAHTHLPEGVALLLATVIGGLIVVVVGVARILQLRSRAQGHEKRKRRIATQQRRARS